MRISALLYVVILPALSGCSGTGTGSNDADAAEVDDSASSDQSLDDVTGDVDEVNGDTGVGTTDLSDSSGDTTADLIEVDFLGVFEPVPGKGFPMTFRSSIPYSGPLNFEVNGTPHVVAMHRGAGAVSIEAGDQDEISVSVTDVGFRGTTVLAPKNRTQIEVAGTIDADTTWSPAQDVLVTADITVSANAVLTVEAGTRVQLASAARIVVEGDLVVDGVSRNPVFFLASDDPWGEVDIRGSARLNWAWFTGGGGDATKAFGHSKSQPVVRVAENASLVMTGGGLVDNPGKAFGTQHATVVLDSILVSRCDTGGEHKGSQVDISNSFYFEFPDGDGKADDDDNDATYLNDPGDGQPCTVTNTVFAFGEDDGIDHNGAEVTLDRVWIDGFNHEGIAASKGKSVFMKNSVVRNCEQGVEVGYGSEAVRIEHSFISECEVGVRWGDSYDWSSEGTLSIANSVVVDNTIANIKLFDDQQGQPSGDDVSIHCSWVDSPEFDGVDGNGDGIPTYSIATGCVTGLPVLTSQCAWPGPEGCQ